MKLVDFAKRCDRFSALDYSTTGEKEVVNAEHRQGVLGKCCYEHKPGTFVHSSKELSENIIYSALTSSSRCVEKMSSERRSQQHPSLCETNERASHTGTWYTHVMMTPTARKGLRVAATTWPPTPPRRILPRGTHDKTCTTPFGRMSKKAAGFSRHRGRRYKRSVFMRLSVCLL